MKMLNIACGSRYHEDWINIDIISDSPLIKKVNLLKGLPFEDNCFDVIYSSHFIEHLSEKNAKFLLKETYRISKPGGIIRIVVPDLENVCREYLKIFDSVRNNMTERIFYEYIVVELLDQLVRTKSGGRMSEIYGDHNLQKIPGLSKYILERVGEDISASNQNREKNKISLGKVKNKIFYSYLNLIRFLIPKDVRENVLVNTTIGELHKWMYDSYSLSSLLRESNFSSVEVCSYNTSRIPNFNRYLLDINKDGTPYKGNASLFVEAIK